MIIKMKNSVLDGYIVFLSDLKLKAKDSRMRTRFIKILQDKLELLVKEEDTLKKEHAKIDENGDIIYNETKMPDGENVKGFMVKNIEKYNADLSELLNEDFVIEINEERLEMIETVKEAVFNYDLELSGKEASIYDSLCTMLEDN